MLAVVLQEEGNFLGSMPIDRFDGRASADRQRVLEQLRARFGEPDQVLLIENDTVAAHWQAGEDF